MNKKLPELLKLNCGKEVLSIDDWKIRRKEIISLITKECYGDMIPAPKEIEIKHIHDIHFRGSSDNSITEIYDIIMPNLTMRFKLFLPQVKIYDSYPVIIDCDLCWVTVTNEIIDEVTKNGFALIVFDRLDLVPDSKENLKRDYELYKTYPDLDFGALMAWSSGFSRIIDALFKLDNSINLNRIIVTGHSRGGKAALLAGALDERIWLTNPNNSGLGGSASFNFPEEKGERMRDIIGAFPYWFNDNMKKYVDCEGNVPFDSHFVKALVSPRLLLITEGVDDLWASPNASKMTTEAAFAAFELYGKADNVKVVYREGGHAHNLTDFCSLISFAKDRLEG